MQVLLSVYTHQATREVRYCVNVAYTHDYVGTDLLPPWLCVLVLVREA